MYCENCQLEIKDQAEKQCPLCGGPLSESPATEAMADKAGGIDLESMLQDDSAAFVLDDEDESLGMAPESQAVPENFILAPNGGDQKPGAAGPAQTSGAIAFSDDSSAEMLDQVLQEYDPLVDEHFKAKKTGSKSPTAILLVALLVCALGGGAYYYFMMREPAAPAPVAPVKIAKPQKQDAVLDKVLRKEPLPAQATQQQATDNATLAAKKADEAKPAQEIEKKTEPPVVAQQPAAVQPVEPAAPSKTPEKAARHEKVPPESAQDKKAPAPPALSVSQSPVAPPAPAVPEQKTAALAKPAADEAKKPVEPAAAQAEKPPVTAAGKPVFSILTGSFRSQSNAAAEADRFNKLGFEARTLKVDLKGKGQWHRVLIGSWTRRADALQAVNDVRRKTGKKDATVVAVE
jgi:cell division protein FtsN